MAKTLTNETTYEVYLEDEEGRGYTGRITGQLIASDETSRGVLDVYLTDDERVLLHDDGKCSVLELENPADELRENLSPGVYAVAMHALGERPVVDL